MVNARSAIGAFALMAPLVAAGPAVVCSTISTVYTTKPKTVTSTSTAFKTINTTVKNTATTTATIYFPSTVTTTSTVTSTSTSTITTAGPTTTVTLPASTSTVTQPASTSTVTAPASTVTITQAASSCTGATSTTQTGQTTTRTAQQYNPTMGLNDYAKLSGRYLGTAVDIPGAELNDPVYMAMANNTHEFGSRTPANIMKYYATEPQQGVFDFSGGDQFIALAHGAGINHIRCHNLIWHSQLPNWLTTGTFDNATLVGILQNHVTKLVTHFGNACTHWDVVNEAFSDGTGAWRPSIWYNTIGWQFVPIAFAAAQAAIEANNLTTKLYYNDYSIETASAKTNSALQLVRNLTSMGIQIDGVGMQAHFIVGQTPYYPDLISNLQSFTNLSVEVAYTELDARINPMPPTAASERSQFNSYKWPVQACFSVPGCVGVTIWDFDDTYSWVPSTFPGQGYADVFVLDKPSNTLVRKECYDGIVDGFTGGNNY